MNNSYKNEEIVQEENSFDVKKIFFSLLENWYWFALSIFLCLLLAFLYGRYATPEYKITSSILIKTEHGNSGGSEMNVLNDLGLFNGNNNVNDEMQVLQSRPLMRQVVDSLHLTTTYFGIGRIKKTELYKSTNPLRLTTININRQKFKNPIKIAYALGANHFGFNNGNFHKQYQLGATIVSPGGSFVIQPNPNFDDSIVTNNYEIFIQDTNAVVDEYLKELKVDLADQNANVIQLSMLDAVPEKGMDILNMLISVYNTANIADKNKTTQQTLAFVDSRLKIVSADLSNEENALEQFKQQNHITDISTQAQLYLNNSSDLDKDIATQQIQLNVLDLLNKYMQQTDKSNNLVPSTLGISDPTLQQLVLQYNALEVKKSEDQQTMTPDNPAYKILLEQLHKTRDNILQSIKNIRQGILLAQQQLQQKDKSLQSQLTNIPATEKQLVELTRQKDIKENLYLFLLQKREETAISQAAAIADSRVVDPAFASSQPVKPVKSLIYLVAFLLGISIPSTILYLRALLNTRVRTREDIIAHTTLPIIGEINKDYSGEPVVVNDHSRTAIAEQFRLIRTNLEFFLYNSNGSIKENADNKCIMVTSSTSGEGKSFFSLNLGSGIALSGKKVAIMELDLRKPKLSEKLNVSNQTGISSYLVGKAQLAEIIKPTKINENLFLINSGPIPPNPTELISGGRMKELFAELSKSFDQIIIDSAPIGMVSDALILSRFADLTLYMIRQNYTFKNQLNIVHGLQQEGKIKNMAIVFNSVKFSRFAYAYGYGYGYGYGYYENGNKRKGRVKNQTKNYF